MTSRHDAGQREIQPRCTRWPMNVRPPPTRFGSIAASSKYRRRVTGFSLLSPCRASSRTMLQLRALGWRRRCAKDSQPRCSVGRASAALASSRHFAIAVLWQGVRPLVSRSACHSSLRRSLRWFWADAATAPMKLLGARTRAAKQVRRRAPRAEAAPHRPGARHPLAAARAVRARGRRRRAVHRRWKPRPTLGRAACPACAARAVA